MYAQAYLDSPLVIRVSGVFGPGGLFTPRGNFVELVFTASAQSGSPIQSMKPRRLFPPMLRPLPHARLISLKRVVPAYLHVGGGEAISWSISQVIFELASVHPIENRPASANIAATRRPRFSALSNHKMEHAGIAPMPPLRDAIATYVEERQHAKTHRSA